MLLQDPQIVAETASLYRDQLARVAYLHQLGLRALIDGHASQKDRKSWVAWLMTARCTDALRSVYNLFVLGAETDACVVFRTIVEVAIDFDFVWGDETEKLVDNYLDHHFFTYRKTNGLIKRLMPGVDLDAVGRNKLKAELLRNPSFPYKTYEEYAAFADAEYRRVKHKYTTRGWTGLGVAERVPRDVSPLIYDLCYSAIGCQASHPSGAMLGGLHQSPSGAAQIPSGELVLHLASVVYFIVLAKMTDHFHLDQSALPSIASSLGLTFPPPPTSK